LHTLRQEAFPPQANRLAIDLIFSGYHGLRLAGRKADQETAAERYLLRGSQGRQPPLKLSVLILR
jgi:hypothetical protein